MAGSGSTLLLDEYFEAGDERFLAEVLACGAEKWLKMLGERWYRDPRPFARRALLAYIDDGCARMHHRGLVKALFKRAEAASDDEAMGRFLVAFDRLIARELRRTYRADPVTGGYGSTQILKVVTPEWDGMFSRKTRRYLQRRAFRYFRRFGRREPVRYGRAIRAALACYRDEHLATVPQVVDAWGLMHILYHGAPALTRQPGGVRVAPGHALAELAPAPIHPAAWRGCLDELLVLAQRAASRPVRGFAIALLERDYATELRGLPVGGDLLRGLLRSAHEEVQHFGVKLLRTAAGLDELAVADWLALLALDNPIALPLVCELVARHVAPARLTLAQCVELAGAQAAPVATLGLAWARAKPIRAAADIAALLPLAVAPVATVRAEATAWLAEVIRGAAFATPEHVRDLLDAKFVEARQAGQRLLDEDPRFQGSTILWGALAESPYEDLRGHLVRHLAVRSRDFAPETLQHVWAAALLAVHAGGRAKRLAAQQIAARIVQRPGEADALLPLLGIALRSIRVAERRTALAALAQAAFRERGLRAAIARRLPELRLFAEDLSAEDPPKVLA